MPPLTRSTERRARLVSDMDVAGRVISWDRSAAVVVGIQIQPVVLLDRDGAVGVPRAWLATIREAGVGLVRMLRLPHVTVHNVSSA